MNEFAFADDASRANALAAVVTPIVRPAIDAAIPMGLITAVDASSGKTTLADFISIIGSYPKSVTADNPLPGNELWPDCRTAVL